MSLREERWQENFKSLLQEDWCYTRRRRRANLTIFFLNLPLLDTKFFLRRWREFLSCTSLLVIYIIFHAWTSFEDSASSWVDSQVTLNRRHSNIPWLAFIHCQDERLHWLSSRERLLDFLPELRTVVRTRLRRNTELIVDLQLDLLLKTICHEVMDIRFSPPFIME